MTSVKSLISAAVAVTIVIVIAALPALAVVHATEGVITRVDSTAKKIVVRTADGTEEIFKFTGKTTVRGAKVAKSGAVDSYFAGREGAHVVVRYTGEAGDKSAVAVDDFGKDTMKVGKGAITGA